MIADRQAELEKLVTKLRPRPSVTMPTVPVRRAADDDEKDMRRIEAYVAKMPPAISGQGGHAALFAAALAAVKGGVGLVRARSIIEAYNARCIPPWSDREIEHKLDDAASADVPDRYILDRDDPAPYKDLRYTAAGPPNKAPAPPAPDDEPLDGGVITTPPAVSGPKTNHGPDPSDEGGKLLLWQPRGVYRSDEILGKSRAGEPRFRTGIETLDERLTLKTQPLNIGLPLGKTIGITGAPSAGKSMMLAQVTTTLASQGLRVVKVVLDEQREDAEERVGQQLGFSHAELNPEYPKTLVAFRKRVRVFDIETIPDEDTDDDPTIEGALEYLLSVPNATGYVLAIDSMNRIEAGGETGREEPRIAIRKRMNVLRLIKRKHRNVVTVFTAECARSAYASRDVSKRTSAVAAMAESRDFEYGVDATLMLTEDDGGGDIVGVEIGKNKIGRQKTPFALLRHEGSASFKPISEETVQAEKDGKRDATIVAVEDRIRAWLEKKKGSWFVTTEIESVRALGGQKEIRAALLSGSADEDGKRKFHRRPRAGTKGVEYCYSEDTTPAKPPPPAPTPQSDLFDGTGADDVYGPDDVVPAFHTLGPDGRLLPQTAEEIAAQAASDAKHAAEDAAWLASPAGIKYEADRAALILKKYPMKGAKP